jgi:hypothetical protein
MSYQVSNRAYEYLLMKQVEGKHSLDFNRINFVG